MCLAVYTLAGGKVLRGFMVSTVADRLGIPFGQAEAMAIAAGKAGLVKLEFGTITLTGEGQARGVTLTAPAVKKSGREPSTGDTVRPSSHASACPARRKTLVSRSRLPHDWQTRRRLRSSVMSPLQPPNRSAGTRVRRVQPRHSMPSGYIPLM